MSDLLLRPDARGLAVIAARVTLLLIAGWCAAGLLKRGSAVMRHTIWLGVIIGAVAVPLLARLGPIQLPVLSPVPSTSTALAPALDDAHAGPAAIESVALGAGSGTGGSVHSRWTPEAVALTLWFAVTLLILARIAAGGFTLRGIVRRGRPAATDLWRRALSHAAGQVGIRALPEVVISGEVDVAFICNALAPTIVLPAAADEWSEDLRHAVLAHELAHIKRRDLVSQSAATIACAMYWFNPLVWTAARRLRAESELASDDVVLESGVRPADYAQHLLNLVTTLRRGAPAAALAMAQPRDFEGRLVAILDRARFRSAPGKARRRAMLGALGAVTVTVGTIVPVPRAPDVIEGNPPAATIHLHGAPAPAAAASTGRAAGSAQGRGYAARLSDDAVRTLLRGGTAAVINPMQTILQYAGTMALNGVQADSVAALNRAYLVALDRIWRPVLRYYATHTVADERPTDDPLAGAQVASIDVLARLVPFVNAVVSQDQAANLPADVAQWLDPAVLTALRTRAAVFPDAVFDMARRGAGARVGGGGVVQRPGRGRAG